MWWIALLGCPPAPPHTSDPVVPEPPVIASVDWSCDLDAERWRLEVVATSWTGGGTLHLTTDGQYVEVHPVRVIASEPDASAETLRVDLAIAADWREASAGSATAFHCSDAPELHFALYDPDGAVADCRIEGELWEELEVPDCP